MRRGLTGSTAFDNRGALDADGVNSLTRYRKNAKIVFVLCFLLALPSIGLALKDAPAPWLRDLCNTSRMPEPGPDPGPDPNPDPMPDPNPSCRELFGGVRDFDLCRQTDDTCRFHVTLDRSTCHQLCRSLGSTCVDADARCTRNDSDNCNTNRITEFC